MSKPAPTIIAILILIISLVMIGRAKVKNQNNTDDNKILVTTSFYPLYYFTSEIGSDKTQVINITPDGVEPHDYEPSPKDIINIYKSKLLIINGGIEPWGEKIKNDLRDNGTIIVEITKKLPTQKSDPHIWLDPVLAQQIVDEIYHNLITIDPSNKTIYLINAQALKSKLNQLDKLYKSGLNNCKYDEIVTTHESFRYLANRYGLKQFAIAGLSPETEPSLKKLTEISKFIKSHNIKTVFFESLVNPELAQTLARESGAKSEVLNPIEGLTEEESKLGKDYFTEMEFNLKHLMEALICQ